MTVTVKLFAAARDLAGRDVVRLEMDPDSTVENLRRRLTVDCPPLAPLIARSAIAVNRDYATDSMTISEGDEIAVIPPVSGG